jgi:hypothetical protein
MPAVQELRNCPQAGRSKRLLCKISTMGTFRRDRTYDGMKFPQYFAVNEPTYAVGRVRLATILKTNW